MAPTLQFARVPGFELTDHNDDLRTSPTHTTSLSKSQLLLVYQLFSFLRSLRSIDDVQVLDRQLATQLYRFIWFLPRPPRNEQWELWFYPSAWDILQPNPPLLEAATKVRALLSLPDALKPLPAPSPPVPLSQAQSPLFSTLSPELRCLIFEFVVTGEDDLIRLSSKKARPPSITRVSRLVRQETLPMFFKCNHFLFKTSHTEAMYFGWQDWIENITDPLLPLLSQFTVKLCRTGSKFKNDPAKHPTVTLCHIPSRNCWSISSSDDWSGIEDEEDRASLESDSKIILHLLSYMLEKISFRSFVRLP